VVAPFLFKIHAVDVEGNEVEFSAPLVFAERDHNDPTGGILDAAITAYNTSNLVTRTFDLNGARVAYAEGAKTDDTAVATRSMTWHVATAGKLQNRSQDDPRFVPILDEAQAVIPAMSALAGAEKPTRVKYPVAFAKKGFTGNAAEVFLAVPDSPDMSFAGQSNRSGGFVTPSLKVTGLSRLTGPVSSDPEDLITAPGNFSVEDFFKGVSAKLFGLIPLGELFKSVAKGFGPEKVPRFVTQALDVAATLQQNVARLHDAAVQHAAELGAEADALKTAGQKLLDDVAALHNDATNPPDLGADLDVIVTHLGGFTAEVEGSGLPQAERQQLVAVARRVQDQLSGATGTVAKLLADFAAGVRLPEVVTARLDWSTALHPWPSDTVQIFKPQGPDPKLALAVEVQAPTKPGGEPSALASCSISPFDLRLIDPVTFIILHFETMEFSMVPGKKPDVNVKLRSDNGVEFSGPLSFVETLKKIIPFDGFSDPPYLDVTDKGVTAGFDLGIPDVAVGVFALSNISLGAHFKVPFLDESIETAFNFSTRENPFRLQVALFAGGGFFGITITPQEVRILEAALEFGAAISVNLVVASGSVSVMAGVYFRLETKDGNTQAQLSGYFRMRGEVDVLGLISACIELYLEFTYQDPKTAIGRATITVEVEIAFFSFSVSISCEKQFSGSSAHLTFEQVMGLPVGAPAGAVRPWDTYCLAFADD